MPDEENPGKKCKIISDSIDEFKVCTKCLLFCVGDCLVGAIPKDEECMAPNLKIKINKKINAIQIICYDFVDNEE